MQTRLIKLTAGAFAGAVVLIGASVSTSDANRGRELFEKRCSGCHTLDRPKVGPPLRNVFGRAAGRDMKFQYSDALKGARVAWDEATLDKWLTDPDSVIPGSDMSFRLDNAAERAGIIGYLKQLGGK